jgi:hypothetical protein
MTDDANTPAQPTEFRVLDFERNCPDCGVEVGQAHIDDDLDGGCDIARCQMTGLQRLMCDLEHDCGQDRWTGWWPGLPECERLGWMLAPGLPDLNRLYAQATWDPGSGTWVVIDLT